MRLIAACVILVLSACGAVCLASGGVGVRPGTSPTTAAAREKLLADWEALMELDSGCSPLQTVLHGALAHGRSASILVYGQQMPVSEWLLQQAELPGWRFRGPATEGVWSAPLHAVAAEVGKGHFEAHLGQGMAILAQVGVPPEAEFQTSGGCLTMREAYLRLRGQVHANAELAWVALAAASFQETAGEEWRGVDGTLWSLGRMLDLMIERDPRRAACGGAHLLAAVAAVVRSADGLEPQLRARGAARVQEGVRILERIQLESGATGLRGAAGVGAEQPLARRIYDCGHALEMLTFALTPEGLRSAWVGRLAAHVAGLLSDPEADLHVESTAVMHALHGLRRYHQLIEEP